MKLRFVLVPLALSLLIGIPQAGLARGGGGGGGHGGGFGGGFAGGGRDFAGAGMRDDGAGMRDANMRDGGYGGGFGDRAGMGGRSDFGSGLDGASRPYGGWGGGDHPDSSDPHSWANQDWANHPDQAFADHTGWWNPGTSGGGAAGRSGLSSDGGLNRVAGSGAARNNVTHRVPDSSISDFGANARSAFGKDFGHNNNWNRWGNRWDRWPYWGDWGWGGVDDWDDLSGYWDMGSSAEPVDYDYGNNITYQGDTVYYGSQPMESASDYYGQAQSLASSMPNVYYLPPPTPQTSSQAVASATSTKSGAQSQSGNSGAKIPLQLSQAPPKDWKSLGVFSLMQQGQTDSTVLFQLMTNKQGALRGTYYNALSNEAKPIKGAVDKKNGRAAWTIGDNKAVVYDTGISNLIKQQAPCLVHFDKTNTEQWILVKLKQPDKPTAAKPAAGG